MYSITISLDECHMALVLSEKGHANIVSMDPSAALSVPGVVGWISAADLPEKCCNTPGRSAVFDLDVEIFATGKVGYSLLKVEQHSLISKNFCV